MSLGFGHMLGAWLPAKAIEYIRKKKFSQPVLAALILGAIIPDADFFLEWTHIIPDLHRTVSHSFVGLFVMAGIAYVILLGLQKYGVKNFNPKHVAIAFGLGIFSHMFYDSLVYPGIHAFWPSDYWLASGTLEATKDTIYQRVGQLTSENKTHIFIIDMGLGAAWIAYFWVKGKLKF